MLASKENPVENPSGNEKLPTLLCQGVWVTKLKKEKRETPNPSPQYSKPSPSPLTFWRAAQRSLARGGGEGRAVLGRAG